MPRKLKVYLETSVISYYAGNPSRDLITLARQHMTVMWWREILPKVDGYVSDYVLEEIVSGDDAAAKKRKKIYDSFPRLDRNDQVSELAHIYMAKTNILKAAELDALHIACATVYKLDCLLTWNCRHIASIVVKKKIEEINDGLGFETPEICTPEELMELEDED